MHNVKEHSVEQTGQNARRMMLLGGMLVAAGLVSTRVEAQAGRAPVQTERVVVVAPVPQDPGDSAYAVVFGDEFRKGVEGKSRRQLSVVTKDKIGEALEASGFSRDALLDDNAANQLARFLQADAYVVGRIEANPIPKADIRLVELRRSGLSGWIHVTGPSGATAKQLADIATDSMEGQIRAAEATRECLDRRDRRDFRGAKERARRAFTFVPHHPAAAMCLAVVFEAEQAPPDSLIPVLELAVKGDSLNTRTWEMLGRQYQAKGAHQDSLKAADAFLRQLQADPSDAKLRTGIAALLITLKEHARSRDVLNAALQQNPGDLQTLQLKARACEDGSLWPCLVEALAAQYDVDTSLVGKLDFYGKIFGAAQQANDTAAMVKWSGEAVRRLPNEVNMWRARLAAFNTAGMTDSALVANRRIGELDRTDIRPLLGMAQIYADRIKIDSTVPLDTTALARVDSLLQRVIAIKSNAAGQPTDTAVWMNVAVMYFKPGSELVQKQVNFALGVRWLEQVLKYDVRKQLTTQAKFFLGLAYFFPLPAFDAQLRERKSCAMVDQEAETVAKAKEALTAGASVSPQTANQLLQYVNQFEQLIPQYRASFKCR